MGFFSELKEDLSQAVNELMPAEDLENAGQPESAEALQGDISLEEMLNNLDEISVSETGDTAAAAGDTETAAEVSVTPEETVEPSLEDMLAAALEAIPERDEAGADTVVEPEAAASEAAGQSMPEAAVQSTPETAEQSAPEETAAEPESSELMSGVEVPGSFEPAVMTDAAAGEEISGQAAEQEAAEAVREESKGAEEKMDNYVNRQVADETAIITQGMYIRGDILSEGSVDVIGTVEGNIDILGKLNINGHIDGNSKAAEIYAEGAKINGEIVSEGAVKIGDSSVIIGNISAKSAAIAGAVKGDIDVQGPVILDSSAIVMGNIKSKSVQINNGAVIEGMCSQCYADVSPTSFFDDYKPETKSNRKANKAAEKNHA